MDSFVSGGYQASTQFLECGYKKPKEAYDPGASQNERLSVENKLTFVYFVVGFPAHHIYRFCAAARLAVISQAKRRG